MNKEMHIWIADLPEGSFNTMKDVSDAIKDGTERIDTGLTHFCSMETIVDKGYRLFIHISNSDEFEITETGCDRTNRELRYAHNLEKMLIGNAFGDIGV